MLDGAGVATVAATTLAFAILLPQILKDGKPAAVRDWTKDAHEATAIVTTELVASIGLAMVNAVAAQLALAVGLWSMAVGYVALRIADRDGEPPRWLWEWPWRGADDDEAMRQALAHAGRAPRTRHGRLPL